MIWQQLRCQANMHMQPLARGGRCQDGQGMSDVKRLSVCMRCIRIVLTFSSIAGACLTKMGRRKVLYTCSAPRKCGSCRYTRKMTFRL